MKDKNEIIKHWRLKEIKKDDHKEYRGKGEKEEFLLKQESKKDPYVLSRLHLYHALGQDDFLNVLSFVEGRKNNWLLETEKDYVVAYPSYTSKPLDFGKKKILFDISGMLGRFHEKSRELVNASDSFAMKKGNRHMERTEEMLKKANTFLSDEDIRPLIHRFEMAAFLFSHGILEQLNEDLRKKGDISYGRIGNKGLAFVNKNICFTAYDGICEDLAIHDLRKLCSVYLEKSKEEGFALFDALEIYEKEHPLTALERRGLYGMMLLPYDTLKELLKAKKERVSGILRKEEVRTGFYKEVFAKGMEENSEDRD